MATTPTPLEQATTLALQLKKDKMSRAGIIRSLMTHLRQEGWTDDLAARKIAEQAVENAFKPEPEPTAQTVAVESIVPPPDREATETERVFAEAQPPVVPPPTGKFEMIARDAIARGENRVLPIKIGGKNPAISWVNVAPPQNDIDT